MTRNPPTGARSAKLSDIVGALERRYDPRWAADWDAVGLVVGDADADVSSVLFAVDPVWATVEEAVGAGVGLLVTHHPLFLAPVHGVPAADAKGRLVHRLIEARCGLYAAHTNADVAQPGVSDALAAALGVHDTRPLVPAPEDPLDALVTYVPKVATDMVIDALTAAGAGTVGAYSRCAFTVAGEGTFVPGVGARPTVGAVGQVARVAETRVEMVLPRAVRHAVIAALRSAHPYEEPAFSLLELASGVPNGRGTGRVGTLEAPEPLAAFADRVARALPATAVGVRSTGATDALIRTVAVCGGAGGSYAGAARAAGADAYVTSDLRHHHATDALEAQRADGGQPMALLDVTHWASEWPFLPAAAERLRTDLAGDGATVSTRVSTLVTDPWSRHVPSPLD